MQGKNIFRIMFKNIEIYKKSLKLFAKSFKSAYSMSQWQKARADEVWWPKLVALVLRKNSDKGFSAIGNTSATSGS
jgi:hypothetical protein